MSTFVEKLQQATNEDKQVNELYKHELRKQFNKLKDDEWDCQLLTIDIDNPIYFNTDGIFSCSYFESLNNYLPFYMLMECKLDKDFNIPEQKAEVLTQVVAYLAQIYFANFVSNESRRKKAQETFKLNLQLLNKIDIMPSTVFIGSKQTCFAVDTEQLKRYYTRDTNFESLKSASTFKNKTEGKIIYEQMLEDSMLDTTSPVFNTSNKYCIADIADIIYRYNKNIKDADDLSPKNLYRAFTRFTTRVLTPETVEKLSNRQQASLLAQFIVNRKSIKVETDLDGSIQGLTVNGLNIEVNAKEWNTFSWIYNLKQYTVDEQKKVTAITDQLISEDDRRRKGDFYTPAIWVEEAHKLLDRNLEPDWRDNYMAWDCAWGTGNLTRDCTKLNGTYIKDLYCSTLHETDLEIGARYNANATKFQYDFLNDDVEDFEKIEMLCKMKQFDTANAILFNTKLYKQAPGLIDGLLGINGKPKKKLLFLINPPYGTASNSGTTSSSKKDIAKTAINELMTEEKIGTCSRQLIAQFIYRIDRLKRLFNADVCLGMFSSTSVLTSNDYKGLLEKIDEHLGYTDGFMFCASDFADVKPNWSIMFSLYNSKNCSHNRACTLGVYRIDANKGVEKCFDKTLYMIDKSDKASWWIREPLNGKKKKTDICYIKSALNVSNIGQHNNAGIEDSIGGFYCNANNINESGQYTSLGSAMFGSAKGINLCIDNFNRVISYFTVRRIASSESSWINWQDEYMIPNTNHPSYKQWESDSIVYCLFNNKSNQSSLRNISYNGKQWDIQNEFFWMSVKDMAELSTGKASKDDFNEAVCDDIEKYGDNRFVYKKLQEVTLSPDAQLVLDKATEIVKKSFKFREDFDKKHPEYHINTWDAGWYQIKGLCKEYQALKADLEEFNALYKALEDRMRPLVYELGFLYK